MGKNIERVQYYPWFQASTGNIGMYPPQRRGDYDRYNYIPAKRKCILFNLPMKYSQNEATTLQYLGSGHTGICFIIFETVLVNFVSSLSVKYFIKIFR